jgi:hypothetical protein
MNPMYQTKLLTQQPLWDESNAPGGILAKAEENHPQSCFCGFAGVMT